MDVYESEKALRKATTVETIRAPLVPTERNNGIVSNRPRTREVSSRYKSPTPSIPSASRRCPSPNITRTINAPSLVTAKRASSAERRRPSTPPSPVNQSSTPVYDSSVDVQLSARKIANSREGLWPSTMRSLNVSFQSDSFSILTSRKEKPVSHALSERTLKPSSNMAHRQAERSTGPRKPTLERKRSSLKGKNVSDQLENSKPLDSPHGRLTDQHRWPSRIGGKVSSNSLNKIADISDKLTRGLAVPFPGSGISSQRRMSLESSKPLQKAASDIATQLSSDERQKVELDVRSLEDNPLLVTGVRRPSSSSGRTGLTASDVRSQSLPISGSRPASPNRCSSTFRGVSPSRARPSTPPRGVSPSRIWPTSTSCQTNTSTSVLSFIADFRKGKKGANQLEDAHQLRLLYNRYLQWRFANARAEAVLYAQTINAEKTLYNVWRNTLALWDSVAKDRIHLKQLSLLLKLYSILHEEMDYLDEWASLERDHSISLSGAIDDLEASTLRLPVTGRARADMESVKVAICSAVDVMQTMGSSICTLLPRVEGMYSLVSGLADLAAQERAMLDECEAKLASTVAMQVEESSLRIHLMQQERVYNEHHKQLLELRMPP